MNGLMTAGDRSGLTKSQAGSYLSPEPMLQSPTFTTSMAARGMQVPTYAYAANNPLRYVDPNGLDYLIFNGSAVTWVYTQGRFGEPTGATKSFPAASGGGALHDEPTSPGHYYTRAADHLQRSSMRHPEGDWGGDPWALHAADLATRLVYNKYWGRKGFFIHGGLKPGSAGCIEVSRYDESQSAFNELSSMLEKYLQDNSVIDVYVEYGQQDPFAPWKFLITPHEIP